MTGGTLPAMTWHNIMTYAHQGIELRSLPGLPPPVQAPTTVADAAIKSSAETHPALLTRKGTDALVHVEQLLDDADRAFTLQGAPAGSFGALDGGGNDGNKKTDAFATAADRGPAAASRGD
jgi:penicillin-binding protein 1A